MFVCFGFFCFFPLIVLSVQPSPLWRGDLATLRVLFSFVCFFFCFLFFLFLLLFCVHSAENVYILFFFCLFGKIVCVCACVCVEMYYFVFPFTVFFGVFGLVFLILWLFFPVVICCCFFLGEEHERRQLPQLLIFLCVVTLFSDAGSTVPTGRRGNGGWATHRLTTMIFGKPVQEHNGNREAWGGGGGVCTGKVGGFGLGREMGDFFCCEAAFLRGIFCTVGRVCCRGGGGGRKLSGITVFVAPAGGWGVERYCEETNVFSPSGWG